MNELMKDSKPNSMLCVKDKYMPFFAFYKVCPCTIIVTIIFLNNPSQSDIENIFALVI